MCCSIKQIKWFAEMSNQEFKVRCINFEQSTLQKVVSDIGKYKQILAASPFMYSRICQRFKTAKEQLKIKEDCSFSNLKRRNILSMIKALRISQNWYKINIDLATCTINCCRMLQKCGYANRNLKKKLFKLEQAALVEHDRLYNLRTAQFLKNQSRSFQRWLEGRIKTCPFAYTRKRNVQPRLRFYKGLVQLSTGGSISLEKAWMIYERAEKHRRESKKGQRIVFTDAIQSGRLPYDLVIYSNGDVRIGYNRLRWTTIQEFVETRNLKKEMKNGRFSTAC